MYGGRVWMMEDDGWFVNEGDLESQGKKRNLGRLVEK